MESIADETSLLLQLSRLQIQCCKARCYLALPMKSRTYDPRSLKQKTLTQFRGESAMRHTVPPGFALYPSTSSGCSEHLLEAINGATRFSYLLSAQGSSFQINARGGFSPGTPGWRLSAGDLHLLSDAGASYSSRSSRFRYSYITIISPLNGLSSARKFLG